MADLFSLSELVSFSFFILPFKEMTAVLCHRDRPRFKCLRVISWDLRKKANSQLNIKIPLQYFTSKIISNLQVWETFPDGRRQDYLGQRTVPSLSSDTSEETEGSGVAFSASLHVAA